MKVFGVGIGVTAVLTLLTPLAAGAGVWALVIIRFVEGVFEVSVYVPVCDRDALNESVAGRYFSVYSCRLVSMGSADGTISYGCHSLCRQLCRNCNLNASQWIVGQLLWMGKSFLRFR